MPCNVIFTLFQQILESDTEEKARLVTKARHTFREQKSRMNVERSAELDSAAYTDLMRNVAKRRETTDSAMGTLNMSGFTSS